MTILNVVQNAFVANLCRRQQWNVLGSSWNCRMLLSAFNQIWSFSTDFLRILQCRSSRTSFNRADTCGRTDGQIWRSLYPVFAIMLM